MRVVVTGGAGFIGSHLVDALIARGDQVTVLDDLSTGSRRNMASALAFGARLARHDICDLAATRRAIARARPHVVFHLAAQTAVPTSSAEPSRDARVNIEGTLNVLDAAGRANARRVVLMSSAAVYAPSAPLPMPEAGPLGPCSPYGQAKLAAEGYTEILAVQHGFSALAVRPANVYGPRQGTSGRPASWRSSVAASPGAWLPSSTATASRPATSSTSPTSSTRSSPRGAATSREPSTWAPAPRPRCSSSPPGCRHSTNAPGRRSSTRPPERGTSATRSTPPSPARSWAGLPAARSKRGLSATARRRSHASDPARQAAQPRRAGRGRRPFLVAGPRPTRRSRGTAVARKALATLAATGLAGLWTFSTDDAYSIVAGALHARPMAAVSTTKPDVGLIIDAPADQIPALSRTLAMHQGGASFTATGNPTPGDLVGLARLGSDEIPVLGRGGVRHWIHLDDHLKRDALALGLGKKFFYLTPHKGLVVGDFLVAKKAGGSPVVSHKTVKGMDAIPADVKRGDFVRLSIDPGSPASQQLTFLLDELSARGLTPVRLGALATPGKKHH